jgi:hypothetical protein
MPFTTNGDFAKGCKTREEVMSAIRLAARHYFPRVKYVMVQAQMNNRKEYKLVFIGGKFAWMASIKKSACRSKAFSPAGHAVLKRWATTALEVFQKSCPESMCEGLVRVDIFQNNTGGFSINEFESFEADVESITREYNLYLSGLHDLRDFYVLKLQHALQL